MNLHHPHASTRGFHANRWIANRERSGSAVDAAMARFMPRHQIVSEKYQRFGLTLMVNHACNLRCTYCYTGAKFNSPMANEIGGAAIQRAFHSLAPAGKLDLHFFGGEPLLESRRILDWMNQARGWARSSGKHVQFNLTTNGTITHPDAWQIMMARDLELAVSFDGSPAIHDRNRRDARGRATALRVEATLQRLTESRKSFRVITVVRPETLADLANGLVYLHDLGVQRVHLSLDLWTRWNAGDGLRLEAFVERAADLWRQWLPGFSLNWFDAKLVDMARVPMTEPSTRCGFGDGEIAVAPSGRLYPCERLIGEDRPGHPLCLPGHALEGDDFSAYGPPPPTPCTACSKCLLKGACDTDCRCSNFVRTGDINRPDGLLCLLNKATATATCKALNFPLPINQNPSSHERTCYAR